MPRRKLYSADSADSSYFADSGNFADLAYFANSVDSPSYHPPATPPPSIPKSGMDWDGNPCAHRFYRPPSVLIRFMDV